MLLEWNLVVGVQAEFVLMLALILLVVSKYR